MKQQVKSREEN